jgi:hypothetical protein
VSLLFFGPAPLALTQYRSRQAHSALLQLDGPQRVGFKAIGLPLASIRQITRYAEGGACEHLRPRLKALIAAQLAEVEIRMRELRALARELRRHHESLDEPPARHARQTPCSCLADARAQQILPRAALVKRPAGRKS